MNLAQATWVKSSFSQGGGSECVEVTRDVPGVIGIRDSKNPGGGAHIVRRAGFRALIRALANDHFPQ